MMEDAIRSYSSNKDIRFRRSVSASARWSSSDERIKQRNRLLGKVWVNNGVERKLVDANMLETYLSRGYVRGTGYSLSNESRESIKKKLLGRKPIQEQIEKCKASRAGYTHSEETRKKD